MVLYKIVTLRQLQVQPCNLKSLFSPFLSPLVNIISRTSRSANASSGDCLLSTEELLLATIDLAKAATSWTTPFPSNGTSWRTPLTETPSQSKITTPPSQANSKLKSLNCDPYETEKTPVAPDLVFRMASTVSTGGRCGCSRLECAERVVIGSLEPRIRRRPATKWMPPSNRNPPWYWGVLRHSVSFFDLSHI